MARTPRPVKPHEGTLRITLLLDADLIQQLDEEVKRVNAEEAPDPPMTRMALLRNFIRESLARRKSRK